MRKKSHVVQKWVDSINVVDENINCDSNELNINESEPSTSEVEAGSTTASVKEKFSEICNKLNVNEKLKGKKIDLKNLISKTTHKIKRQSSRDTLDMEQPQQQQQHLDEEVSDNLIDKAEQSDDVKAKIESITNNNNNKSEDKDNEDEVEVEEEGQNEIKSDTLTVQRCHISVLGRSSSENPNPPSRNRRLTDIGRSFSVANDSELPIDSSENLIYDADEDVSIAIPSSFETSPSVLSNTTNSNNQLDKATLRPSLRPLREHTVSEGHYSPHVLPKNPLLRDSSFQVRKIIA